MQLADIKGIGEKRIAALQKAGIQTPEQLLLCYPYKYLDLSQPPNFSALCDGDEVAFYASVASPPTNHFVRRGLFYTKTAFMPVCVAKDTEQTQNNPCYVTHSTENAPISATFFNQRFISKQLQVGKLFCVSGKIKRFRQKVELQAPVLSPYNGGLEQCIPLYAPPKGLSSTVLRDAVKQVLQRTRIESRIPNHLCDQHQLMRLDDAIRTVHMPKTYQDAQIAARSIAIECLAGDLCTFLLSRKRQVGGRTRVYKQELHHELAKLVDTLPYALTCGQKSAVKHLLDGLACPEKPLNALLAGDVGCGKTVVAFLLMYYAALNGYQSALMAPTEILAQQHYRNALKLFENTTVNVALLTASQNARFKSDNLFAIKNGVAQIVIGTHAMIQSQAQFLDLGLVIVDEQQRFGVLQRGNLENKGRGADTVVMSATPIPRTLALTLYGDLDVVEIRDMPPQKAQTVTRFVPVERQQDMYLHLQKKCEAGEQCFVVCPRIDEDEDGLPSVEQVYHNLLPMFKAHGIAALHGRLSEQEKSRIMDAFAKKESKILVTTTVIEVGIDYKDATSMVVLCAERYGLSQLHQLRGRVGRGEKESYCFVLSENDSAKERLDFFCNTKSGFALAEYDFEKRGAGDFLGTRQHGNSASKIAPEMIAVAKSLADTLCTLDEFCLRPNMQSADVNFIKNLTLN